MSHSAGLALGSAGLPVNSAQWLCSCLSLGGPRDTQGPINNKGCAPSSLTRMNERRWSHARKEPSVLEELREHPVQTLTTEPDWKGHATQSRSHCVFTLSFIRNSLRMCFLPGLVLGAAVRKTSKALSVPQEAPATNQERLVRTSGLKYLAVSAAVRLSVRLVLKCPVLSLKGKEGVVLGSCAFGTWARTGGRRLSTGLQVHAPICLLPQEADLHRSRDSYRA